MAIPSTPAQTKVFNLWTSGPTLTCTGLSAITNGNCGGIIYPANTGMTVASIAQTGASWSRLVISNSVRDCEIWVAPNFASAGTSITMTLSAAPSFNSTQGAIFFEWAGLDTVLASLTGPTNVGTGSGSPTTNSVTPTRECLILIGTRAGGNVTAGPSGGFTGVNIDALRGYAGYQVVAAPSGSYTGGWTATGTYDAVIATLYAPAAAGGGKPTHYYQQQRRRAA